MTPKQIKAARALAGWSRPDLAKAAGVSGSTIKNLESGKFEPRRAIAAAVERAFQEIGVAFTEGGVTKTDRSD